MDNQLTRLLNLGLASKYSIEELPAWAYSNVYRVTGDRRNRLIMLARSCPMTSVIAMIQGRKYYSSYNHSLGIFQDN